MSTPLLRVMGALTLVAALTIPGAARASNWQTLGPAGYANVDALVMAPSLPNRLYVAPYKAGVFRSNDQGESWIIAREGLPMDAQTWALAVSPTNPDLVLAGFHNSTPLYRSEDGGRSWTPSSTGLVGGDVVALAFSPSDPSRVLAGGPSWGIYRSSDAGLTWTPGTGFPTSALYSLGIHPTDPQIALAATYTGLYRTTDGGATWSLALAGDEFQSVSWSPPAPGRAYASRWAYVYCSTDSGVTWTSSLADSYGYIVAVRAHPANANIVLAAGYRNEWCSWVGDDAELVVRSTDGGVTWTRTRSLPCEWEHYVDTLEIDPTGPGHVVIGVHCDRSAPYYPAFADGVWRSDDGGVSGWALKTNGIAATPVAALASDLGGGLWVRCNGLFYGSQLNGPWSSRTPPSIGDPGVLTVRELEVNLTNTARIQETGRFRDWDVGGGYIACAFNGVWYPDACAPGIHCGTFPPDFTSASNHGDGSVVYVFADDGTLYRSTNGGLMFSTVANAFPAVEACIDHSSSDRLFALDTTGNVRLSTDGGVTWTLRSGGLPSGTPVTLLMDRGNGDHLLAAYTTVGIFETADGGINWSVVPIDLGGAQVKAADWDAAGERAFLLTTTGRVYVTGLGFVEGDLPTRSLTSLSYSAVHDVLLVGSTWMGAFALDLSATGAPVIARLPSSSLELSVAPNPSSSFATIRFAVPAKAAGARLDVYDAAGRLVRHLRAELAAGDGEISWGGREGGTPRVPPGVYFVRLSSGSEKVVRRVVLLR